MTEPQDEAQISVEATDEQATVECSEPLQSSDAQPEASIGVMVGKGAGDSYLVTPLVGEAATVAKGELEAHLAGLI